MDRIEHNIQRKRRPLVLYLHLPLDRVKGVGQALCHASGQAAVDEVLERVEAERRFLPQRVQISVHRKAADGEGEGTCSGTGERVRKASLLLNMNRFLVRA